MLTPANEINHYPTASLLILLIFTFFLSLIVSIIVIKGDWIITVNQPIYLFLQSLRTNSFDAFFIFISFFSSPLSLFALILSITLYSIYFKDWRTLRFWLSLVLTCSLMVFILSWCIDIPETEDLIKFNITLSYPAPTLTFGTALFGFLIFYINSRYRTIPTLTVRICLIVLLILSGIGLIYLGDNWFTSVIGGYFIGLTLCLLHWILYRRIYQVNPRSQLPIIFSFLVLILASLVASSLYFKNSLLVHKPVYNEYILSDREWWNQQQPLLPLYTTNRIGKRTGLLNLQYAGSIETLEKALIKAGWKKGSPSFLYSLILRAGGNTKNTLPLITQLYLNRKATLVMTYNKDPKQPLLVLRMWRSNYHLGNYSQPIWLGSLQYHLVKKKGRTETSPPPEDIFTPVMHALDGFHTNRINLTNIEPLPQTVSPSVLFIKEPVKNF
ncbi:LssY C-terminal domain-containing protein [Legionella adelaidensis]|uniref:LssY C-terminal domain-containing protein n=1 Tax=Legionella adelaidensis TaxID=45056 RepID=UPI0010414BA8|nr:LssY C-terminal domain-containing protein [Legionella adelaidensis]